MDSNRQELNHLLLMAKLLAVRQDDRMLCYFINMAIDHNRQTAPRKHKSENAA